MKDEVVIVGFKKCKFREIGTSLQQGRVRAWRGWNAWDSRTQDIRVVEKRDFMVWEMSRKIVGGAIQWNGALGIESKSSLSVEKGGSSGRIRSQEAKIVSRPCEGNTFDETFVLREILAVRSIPYTVQPSYDLGS